MYRVNIRAEGVFTDHLWPNIIQWFCVLLFIALHFFLGTKLKSLGSHWLNYLSVCGISIIALVIGFYGEYIAILIALPFFSVLPLIPHSVNDYIVISILAILPSVIIWLGMLYKSRRLKRKEGHTTISLITLP
jgi:hypothetical protein